MEHAAALTFEQIRQRAYELWERNHQPMGFEIEFWLMAEKELRSERDRSVSANGTEAVMRARVPPPRRETSLPPKR